MASDFDIVLCTGMGVGINAIHALTTDADPFPVMFTGALWMGACVLIGSANHDVGLAFAAVYLLAVLVYRGEAFATWLNTLVKGVSA